MLVKLWQPRGGCTHVLRDERDGLGRLHIQQRLEMFLGSWGMKPLHVPARASSGWGDVEVHVLGKHGCVQHILKGARAV